MEPCHHGLEHQAAIRPRPGLTRLRRGGSAGRSTGNADLRTINRFSAPTQRRRRLNPPKSFSAINRNAQSDRLLEARLPRYLPPPLFPVRLRDLPRVACHQVPRPPFDIGPFHIETSLICHPGPTVGYRVEGDGGVVAYICDHEPALCLHNGRWPGPEWISGFDLAVGVDLLIHDAQYTERSTNGI